MSLKVLHKAVFDLEHFRALFVQNNCKTEQDLMALSVALMQQAEIIYNEIGGKDFAAKQFYLRADMIVDPNNQ